MQSRDQREMGHDFWAKLVAEFETIPGETRRAFAKRHRLSYDSFCKWVRRIRCETQHQSDEAALSVNFVEVKAATVSRDEKPSAVLDLGVAQLHFDELCEPAWVAELVIRLQHGGRSC